MSYSFKIVLSNKLHKVVSGTKSPFAFGRLNALRFHTVLWSENLEMLFDEVGILRIGNDSMTDSNSDLEAITHYFFERLSMSGRAEANTDENDSERAVHKGWLTTIIGLATSSSFSNHYSAGFVTWLPRVRVEGGKGEDISGAFVHGEEDFTGGEISREMYFGGDSASAG